MKIKFFILFMLLFSFSIINAQIEFRDTAFSKTSLPPNYPPKGLKYLNVSGAETRAIAVDAQGRIVAVVAAFNSNIFYVYRLKADGTSDSSFAGNTKDSVAIISPTVIRVNSVLIQPDGKILIGGYKKSLVGDADMMVMRLNADGTRDLNFGNLGNLGVWVKDFNSQADSVYKMALQKSGAIIIAGTSDTIGVNGGYYGRMTVLRLGPNGKEDTFIFKPYISPANIYYIENVTGLDLFNDTIYVGASYSGSYNTVLKLLPNGKPAWTSSSAWSTSGRIDFVSNGALSDLAVRKNGDIFISGADTYNLYLTKINSDGTRTNGTSAFPQYQISLKNMLIDKDGKIILTGSVGSAGLGYIYSLKTDENGNVDSTFGVSGKLLSYGASNGYTTYNQMAFTPDHRLLLIGRDAKNPLPVIQKVYLRPVMHIIGNNYVLPKTAESYKADVPAIWGGYNYTWTYSGSNILYFTSTGGPSISIYFTDSATSGMLICKAYNGSTLVSYETKDIFVNNKPSDAYKLAKLQCPAEVTDCGIGYIDYFHMNSISNDNSGCSENGYADYTRSDFNDTLSAGGVYSARLRIPNNGGQFNYIGIWIDYDNDGVFNSTDEFVGNAYSTNEMVNVNNITLQNKEGYVGAKRLRVRSQPDSAFIATDACPVRGEIGETEDYLIMITTQPTLEAPQIITPNDDGLNDFFVVRGVNPKKGNKLVIFDRLGTLKFTASGYENNWNGVDSKGEKLSPGTYFYVFSSEKDVIRGFLEIRY